MWGSDDLAGVAIASELSGYRPALVASLVGRFLIIEKVPDHDIRIPIFGVGSEVPISRGIRILVIATRNLHDLPRTRLAPSLDLINCSRQFAEEGYADHDGGPYFASTTSDAVEHR